MWIYDQEIILILILIINCGVVLPSLANLSPSVFDDAKVGSRSVVVGCLALREPRSIPERSAERSPKGACRIPEKSL